MIPVAGGTDVLVCEAVLGGGGKDSGGFFEQAANASTAKLQATARVILSILSASRSTSQPAQFADLGEFRTAETLALPRDFYIARCKNGMQTARL